MKSIKPVLPTEGARSRSATPPRPAEGVAKRFLRAHQSRARLWLNAQVKKCRHAAEITFTASLKTSMAA